LRISGRHDYGHCRGCDTGCLVAVWLVDIFESQRYTAAFGVSPIEHDEGTDLRFPVSISCLCCASGEAAVESVWDQKEWGHLDDFCQHHWTILGWNENNWSGGLPKVGILKRDTRHARE
jgi:hypothetical protein